MKATTVSTKPRKRSAAQQRKDGARAVFNVALSGEILSVVTELIAQNKTNTKLKDVLATAEARVKSKAALAAVHRAVNGTGFRG